MAIKELSNVQIKSGNDWYKLCPFPVGYIYMGYTSTSPATTYGGTWSSISGGRYFRAAAANDAKGSNTITIDNMPNHGHNIAGYHVVTQTNWGDGHWFGGDYAGNIGMDDYAINVTSQGGGARRFIQHIKTYMLGDVLLNFYLLDGGER